MSLLEPTTESGRAGLGAVRHDPSGALVACDYDGTLAPIVDDPMQAVPAAGAVDALVALAARVAQVAIVTGRPAELVVDLGGLARVPGLTVLGLYGAERWHDGRLTPATPPPGLLAAMTQAVDVVESHPGVSIEDKGASFAVHTRQAPDPDGALAAVSAPLLVIASDHDLRVEPGRYVVELRGPGFDKGRALDELVAETGARSVVFVGDDLGDLAAFAAVRRLASEGVPGLCVASASAEVPEVSAAADLTVDGPPGVVDFLRSLA